MKTLQRGLTLIELIVSIAVLCIISCIAMPYVNTYFAEQEVQGLPRLLTVQIQKARQSAVILQRHVVICPSLDFINCEQDWNSGLLMFVDHNRNRRHDETEQVLEQLHLDLKYGQLSWSGSLSRPSISLRPQSGHAYGSMGNFKYCGQHGQGHRKIVLNKMALTRVESPDDC